MRAWRLHPQGARLRRLLPLKESICGLTRADAVGPKAISIRKRGKWASVGFEGSPFDLKNKPDPRVGYVRNRSPLKTNDNSESEDDFDPETGEINDEIASPEVLVCSEDRCPQHIHSLDSRDI
jgi:hypothetical protein